MAIVLVRAAFTEQSALEAFFSNLFGLGTCQVILKRGRYQCTIPRHLAADETDKLRDVVQPDHNEQA